MQKFVQPIICLLILVANQALACVIPVPIETRASDAQYIVFAKPIKEHCYYSENNIYTLTQFNVISSLKGKYKSKIIALITMGGQLNDDLQISYPHYSIDFTTNYMLFLNENESKNDDNGFRKQNPKIVQAFAQADGQGYIPVANGYFKDIVLKEKEIQDVIPIVLHHSDQTTVLDSDGHIFDMQNFALHTQNIKAARSATISSITNGAGIVKTSYRAGLTSSIEEIIINGSGFGNIAGSVVFPNADNGGASKIGQVSVTDILSWTDTKIRVKIPFQAGTGTLNIIDGAASVLASSPIKIDYSIIAFYSAYSGYTSASRHFVELVDKNKLGGYTFFYTNSMDAVPAAKSKFEAAMNTWRCASNVNYQISPTLSTTQKISPVDEINIVTFDNTGLSTGVAARCNVRYKGKANATCDKENTFWYIADIDIQFSTSYSWYFGNDTPTNIEVDFQSIALHELGHSLTLGHVINPVNIMHYFLTAGQAHRTLELTSQYAVNTVLKECTTQNCIQKSIPTTVQPMILLPVSSKDCPSITNDGSAYGSGTIDPGGEVIGGESGNGGYNGQPCSPKCVKISVKKN
jgi:hypothetical protein